MGALGDLRTRVADALGELLVANPEWSVLPLPVDAITPPAFMLVWSDPWLTPATSCHFTARLQIFAISGRVDPDPGIELLEQMIEAAIVELESTAGLAVAGVGAPAPFDLGGVRYQIARLTVTPPVPIGD